jgi:major vault protein
MKKNQPDAGGDFGEVAVVRIPPYHFIHVLDQTTNVTRVEIGPQTFVRKDNEKVLMGATKMIIVPPRHYCVIRNPVARDEDGEIIRDVLGQIKLLHADQEVRFTQDPFPLHPGNYYLTSNANLINLCKVS